MERLYRQCDTVASQPFFSVIWIFVFMSTSNSVYLNNSKKRKDMRTSESSAPCLSSVSKPGKREETSVLPKKLRSVSRSPADAVSALKRRPRMANARKKMVIHPFKSMCFLF